MRTASFFLSLRGGGSRKVFRPPQGHVKLEKVRKKRGKKFGGKKMNWEKFPT
jgi:hypothetical protein